MRCFSKNLYLFLLLVVVNSTFILGNEGISPERENIAIEGLQKENQTETSNPDSKDSNSNRKDVATEVSEKENPSPTQDSQDSNQIGESDSDIKVSQMENQTETLNPNSRDSNQIDESNFYKKFAAIEVSETENQTETPNPDFKDFDERNSDEVEESNLKSNVTLPELKKNITKANCLNDKVYGPVEIVNATRLVELLILEPGPSNRTRNSTEIKLLPGPCVVVLFYARWCVFSSQAAPHFNAIPKFFPHIKAVAIDAMKYQSFNTQHGIVGVPTLVVFHNGKPVAKFNETVYTLETFSRFITHLTNQQPNGSLYVTSADFSGPVSSTPSNETDYCLVLSWIFIAACALYFTSKSHWWRQFVELVQNTWRESNAQHEHVD